MHTCFLRQRKKKTQENLPFFSNTANLPKNTVEPSSPLEKMAIILCYWSYFKICPNPKREKGGGGKGEGEKKKKGGKKEKQTKQACLILCSQNLRPPLPLQASLCPLLALSHVTGYFEHCKIKSVLTF